MWFGRSVFASCRQLSVETMLQTQRAQRPLMGSSETTVNRANKGECQRKYLYYSPGGTRPWFYQSPQSSVMETSKCAHHKVEVNTLCIPTPENTDCTWAHLQPWAVSILDTQLSLFSSGEESSCQRHSSSCCTRQSSAQEGSDLVPLTLTSQGAGNHHMMSSAKTVHGLSLIMCSRYPRALQPSSLLAPFLLAH